MSDCVGKTFRPSAQSIETYPAPTGGRETDRVHVVCANPEAFSNRLMQGFGLLHIHAYADPPYVATREKDFCVVIGHFGQHVVPQHEPCTCSGAAQPAGTEASDAAEVGGFKVRLSNVHLRSSMGTVSRRGILCAATSSASSSSIIPSDSGLIANHDVGIVSPI